MPDRVYRIEDISHAARVYRKSREGFISLRSALKDTTLKVLRDMGLYAAIIGKAYYIGAIDLKEALEVAK